MSSLAALASLLATNSRPPAALGVVKCSKPLRLAENLVAPVAGSRPYRVAPFHPTAQTRPPAKIGGPFASLFTAHPASGVKLGAAGLSESARSPSAQLA